MTCLPQQRERQGRSRSTASQKRCAAHERSCSSNRKAGRASTRVKDARRFLVTRCDASVLSRVGQVNWELLQTAANAALRESIKIAALCKVAFAELQTMLQFQSHKPYQSLRNPIAGALSANLAWSAPMNVGKKSNGEGKAKSNGPRGCNKGRRFPAAHRTDTPAPELWRCREREGDKKRERQRECEKKRERGCPECSEEDPTLSRLPPHTTTTTTPRWLTLLTWARGLSSQSLPEQGPSVFVAQIIVSSSDKFQQSKRYVLKVPQIQLLDRLPAVQTAGASSVLGVSAENCGGSAVSVIWQGGRCPCCADRRSVAVQLLDKVVDISVGVQRLVPL